MPLSDTAIAKVKAWQGYGPISALANPSRSLVLLANIFLTKLSDSTTAVVGACTGRPAWNGSGVSVQGDPLTDDDGNALTDDDGNTLYDEIGGFLYRPVMEFPKLSQTLEQAGEPNYAAPLVTGDLVLWNGDKWFSGENSANINYLDKSAYSWDRVEYLIGVTPDDYSDFEAFGGNKFADRPDVGPHFIRLRPGPAIIDLGQPAYDEKLPGFDCALDSDDGSLDVAAGNSDQNIPAAEDARWRCRVKIPATASAMAIWSTRNSLTGTAAGFCWSIDTSGYPILSLGDGSNEVSVTNATAIDDGTWWDLLALLDRATNKLYGWAKQDGGSVVSFSTDEADATALGAVTNTNLARTHELTGGGSALTGAVDEVVFGTGNGIGYSADLRLQHLNGPASIHDLGAQYVWHMDEDTGVAVNNAYEPTLEGVVNPPIANVPKNIGIEGTAATREIDFGDNYDKDLTANGDSFSFAIWARPTAGSVQQVLVSKKNGVAAGNAGWMMYLTSGDKLTVRLSDGTRQVEAVSASALPIDGAWRMYCFTVDAASGVRELKAWVTDSSGATATQEGSTVDLDSGGALGDTGNAETLRIGESGAGTSPWQGDVSTASIYSSALTQAEIERLSRIIPTKADKTTLDSCWPMDEGASTLVADSVGSVDGTKGAGGTWFTRNGKVTPGTATNGGWVATLTGSLVNGSAGVYRQQLYGEFEGVRGIRVDHRGHDHTAIGGFADCIVEEIHHGPDDLYGVDHVTEGGVTATLTTHYKVSSDGKYVFWDMTSAPQGPLRYSGRGAKFDAGANGGWKEFRVGPILREILTTNNHATATEVPTPTEFNNEFPYRSGIVIRGGESRADTLGDVMRRALAGETRDPGGLYWANDMEGAGLYFGHALVNPDDFAADVALTDKTIALDGIASGRSVRRVYSVSVGYGRQWNRLSDSEIALGASTTNRTRFSQEFSFATATSSTVTKADGREIVVHSPLARHADAQTWAAHLLAMLDGGWGVVVTPVRHLWQAHMIRSGRARPDVVSVQSSYYEGLSSAVNFVVIGVENKPPRAGEPLAVRWVLWRPA